MKCHAILLLLAGAAVQVACDHLPPKAPKIPSLFHGQRGSGRWGTVPIAPLEKTARVPRSGSQPQTQAREITTRKAVAIGALLALNSGVVNGVCLSGLLGTTKQASSAVTGAWTNSALGAATGDGDQLAFNGKCILSYFFGSFISGVVNPNPKPFELDVASARTALWIGSALLLAAGTEKSVESREFVFLAAMANGITNSLTSTTTANLVRSAHFSGITSDIGTFLGQVLGGNYQNSTKLRVFCVLALAFWTGGYASYSLARTFGARTLMFSSILYLILGAAAGFL